MPPKPSVYTIPVVNVYPFYVAKAEKKGRSREEVDAILRWLTGYSQEELGDQLEKRADFESFFSKAPKPNPARLAITGTVCGVRVEEIEDPLMRDIRCLDKLVDELAKGRTMAKILRAEAARAHVGCAEPRSEGA